MECAQFPDEKGNVVPATHYGMSVDFPLEMQMTVTFEVEKGKAKIMRKPLSKILHAMKLPIHGYEQDAEEVSANWVNHWPVIFCA